jgi:hypothetical protein
VTTNLKEKVQYSIHGVCAAALGLCSHMFGDLISVSDSIVPGSIITSKAIGGKVQKEQ